MFRPRVQTLPPIKSLIFRSFIGCKALGFSAAAVNTNCKKMGQSVVSFKKKNLLLPIPCSVGKGIKRAFIKRWKDVKFILKCFSKNLWADLCLCSRLSRPSASTRPSTHRRLLSKRSMPGISSYCLRSFVSAFRRGIVCFSCVQSLRVTLVQNNKLCGTPSCERVNTLSIKRLLKFCVEIRFMKVSLIWLKQECLYPLKCLQKGLSNSLPVQCG